MNVTDLKTLIAGELNHCLQPHFHLWLWGVVPHLHALTQCLSLNQHMEISMFGSNIMVETHLLNEKARKISPAVVRLLFLCMPKLPKLRILLPGKSDWAGRRDCSGLLWLCFLLQVKETGNVLKESKKCGWKIWIKQVQCKVKGLNSKRLYNMSHKYQMLLPDVFLAWSCLSPRTSVVLFHPERVSEIWNRSQNPSSKSHLLYLEPSTENTQKYTVFYH